MTATTHPDTELVVDGKVPTIRLVREFAAPPDRVFAAHTDPDLFACWIGPRDLATTVDTWDCRTGGSWAFHQTRGADTFAFYGSFHEIRPAELIVQTFTFAGFPDGVSLERLQFEAVADDRTRLIATSLLDSFEGRDAMIASGMEVGVREGYEKLDDLLVVDRGAGR